MDEFTVGLLYPQGGPAGLFGPSCLNCSTLAADDINARGGVLGREVTIRPIDAAAGRDAVVGEVDRLISSGGIDAVVGWHTSDVRRAVSARLDLRVPYVYTALYEGGESTDGVFLTGETPDEQIRPALEWLARERDLTDWFIVGSDYVWARGSARSCLSFLHRLGHRVRGTRFVPLGRGDYRSVVDEVARSGAAGVVMLLLGQEAVEFNRAFSAAGLDDVVTRYSPLMDEHMLMASGPEATGDLYASAGFFESMVTASNLDFSGRYFTRFGAQACAPTSMGESCFEGMLLLEALLTKARSADVRDLMVGAPQTHYAGARGETTLRDGHARQTMYLASAAGCDFDVLTEL